MEQEKEAFYVVKKGDVIGIYKSLRDLAEAGISGNDPSLSLYVGYGLSKRAELYLGLCGIKNAAYSISASDVNENTFGKLVPCPPQQPTSFGANTSNRDPSSNRFQQVHGKAEAYLDSRGIKNAPNSPSASHANDITFGKLVPQQPTSFGGKSSNRDPSPNRLQQLLGKDLVGSISLSTDSRINHMNFTNQVETQTMSSNLPCCIVEFDGASKGNPGPAGAGVVLRAEDGRVIGRLREGVGIATNNVAEYRAAILGMKYALRKGFKRVCVQGDSNLVVMQVQGRWKIKSQNLIEVNKEAKVLKEKFTSFQINHVAREFNSEADALANQAVNLINGQIQEDWTGL